MSAGSAAQSRPSGPAQAPCRAQCGTITAWRGMGGFSCRLLWTVGGGCGPADVPLSMAPTRSLRCAGAPAVLWSRLASSACGCKVWVGMARSLDGMRRGGGWRSGSGSVPCSGDAPFLVLHLGLGCGGRLWRPLSLRGERCSTGRAPGPPGSVVATACGTEVLRQWTWSCGGAGSPFGRLVLRHPLMLVRCWTRTSWAGALPSLGILPLRWKGCSGWCSPLRALPPALTMSPMSSTMLGHISWRCSWDRLSLPWPLATTRLLVWLARPWTSFVDSQ